MNICKDLFLGRNKYGEKYYLSVELRERTNGVSVNHQVIESYQELSFTGTLIGKYGSIINYRGWVSGGQNYERLLEITEPAKGFSRANIRRLYAIWREYHLNDMQSHCEHQDKAIKWDIVEPCPITGYRAGSAWLVQELPDSIISEVYALTGKMLSNA
jgi:hypothetical protein